MKNKVPLSLLFIFSMAFLTVTSQTGSNKSVYKNIISCKGDKLMDGDKEFRFMGLAAPNIQQNESQI
ncbi:MAG: hypothetical protein ACOYN4_07560, partial [Bacteroidales bacterium]